MSKEKKEKKEKKSKKDEFGSLIQAKMKEIADISAEHSENNEATMMCIVLGSGGINMSMAGTGHYISAMIAAAIADDERIRQAVTLAMMMIEAKRKEDEEGKTEPAEPIIEKPKTEA